VKKEYGIDVMNRIPSGKFDAVILAVAHNGIHGPGRPFLRPRRSVVYDVKGVLNRERVDARL
jgi:hypothetical protein